jgi:RNA polymerase sigma factor (TIGR02999 family)
VSDVTRILDRVQHGDPQAAEELLPLVYEELRKLAAHKMANEAPGQTLQPTALVHEAFLRLVNVPRNQNWDGRGHFFAAAGEAMRRILVESARRKQRIRHGGGQERLDVSDVSVAAPLDDDKIILVNDALESLAREDALQAEVVKLRFFAGLSNAEVAVAVGVSEKTVQRYWSHAKAWLYGYIRGRQ